MALGVQMAGYFFTLAASPAANICGYLGHLPITVEASQACRTASSFRSRIGIAACNSR